MTRISSKTLFFTKRVFPLLWFGFLAYFVVIVIRNSHGDIPLMGLVAPAAMAALGYFLMKKLVWDLMDEVWDGGDYLIVRARGQEAMIHLSDVMNVSVTTLTNPPRITLRLVTPCVFGTEVSFAPLSRFSLLPFARNPIAEDLMVRVDRARRRATPTAVGTANSP